MTAKEDKINFISHYLEDWIPETKMSETIERLNEVIESYCRGQRELCEDEIFKINISIDNGLIAKVAKQAPMPEL